jgi:hypothetical protein
VLATPTLVWQSRARFLLQHHHHARRCAIGILGGSTTSAASLERGEEVVINTVCVPEYGGAFRLQRRKDRLRDLEIGKRTSTSSTILDLINAFGI